MYYTVYKTTNLTNGKIYIGVHKTTNLDDDYMGSGKILKRAIKKYGIENFTKEYLEVFDNPDDMFEMEASLVNEDFVNDLETYNLKLGGEGGWDHLRKDYYGSDKKKEIGKSNWKLGLDRFKLLFDTNERFRETHIAHMRSIVKLGQNKVRELYPDGVFYGRKHSEETKKKMSDAKKGKYTRQANSQYGTMWITDGKESKKIKKDQSIPDGWNRGRKQKVKI